MIVKSLLLAAGFGLVFSSFYFAPASSAQSVSPSPTPTPPVVQSSVPTPTPTPNPEDEVIKVDTELVNLNVKVVDRFNRPINNVPAVRFYYL